MPRQPHVAGLSGERRVVVVELGGSSFTRVSGRGRTDRRAGGRTDGARRGVAVGGSAVLTRDLSRRMVAREKRSTRGGVSSDLFVAAAETCAADLRMTDLLCGVCLTVRGQVFVFCEETRKTRQERSNKQCSVDEKAKDAMIAMQYSAGAKHPRN